ncbi:MAG: hypothetical protein ACT4QE_11535 [Anaerolineales bacterium]
MSLVTPAMNWSTLLPLALALASCVIVMARIERNRWFMGVLFYVLPVLLLMGVWAWLTNSWAEAGVAVLLAALLSAAWWFVWGRRMQRAESTIKVWGQDSAPKSKAALQAEIDQLKDEKQKLEEELRKLKQTKDE